MELQPLLHVWTHTDNDLVDLTITTTQKGQRGTPVTRKSEVVHTSEHPFLTAEKGFTPTRDVKMGMHVLRTDGSVGVVTGWRSVHGTKVMYNLEVAQDHTFTVGDGQWVVHNECNSKDLRKALRLIDGDSFQAHHVIPCELEGAGALGRLITASGLDLNSAVNGRKLPNTPQGSLDELLPYHSSSHADYTEFIRGLLEEHTTNLADSNGNFDSAQAWEAVQDVIAKGNAYINDLAAQVTNNADPVRLC
jgi:A nuclease family of the HNH/ENDO VII superfamily with conserved AHH